MVDSSTNYENIKINKAKLLENFIDIKNIANIHLLVCYEVLFSMKGLIKNYGSYSIIIIILINWIIIIIYYSKNLYKQIKNKINEIIFCINNIEIVNIPVQEEKINEDLLKSKFKKRKTQKNVKQKSEKMKINKSKNYKSSKFNLKKESNKRIEEKSKKMSKGVFKNKKNLYLNFRETTSYYSKDISFKNKSFSKTKDNLLTQIKKTMAYNDTELNDLEYTLARKCDKRTYCQYYFSLLKTKHPLFFTFININDYNSKIIKIDLFLFNFALFFAVNTIFFDDNTMHKIYKNKGAFDLIEQLPQIIYSFLISSLFSFILEMLALTEGVILEIKKIKKEKLLNRIIISYVKKIKIKIVLYFIIDNIFLILFWYYISMFCAIYVNTQSNLIKDTLSSFIFSFIEPLAIYLIPGIFRILALSKKNKNMHILYKFSKILQSICV